MCLTRNLANKRPNELTDTDQNELQSKQEITDPDELNQIAATRLEPIVFSDERAT